MPVIGYMLYAGGRLFLDADAVHVAREVDKPLAQVLGRWCLQHGVIPCVSSALASHAKEDWDIFRFVLRARFARRLDDLNRMCKYDWDPRHVA